MTRDNQGEYDYAFGIAGGLALFVILAIILTPLIWLLVTVLAE